MKQKGIRDSADDRVFNVINIFFVVIFLVLFIVPLLNIVASSLSSADALWAGKVWIWPRNFSLSSYKLLLSLDLIWVGYANSIFYTITGTCINLLVTIMAAYPLSRRGLMGRGPIMGLFAVTMFFSGGMIPLYMVVRSLGLIDNRLSLLLPSALSVYNMIIARTFFMETIPYELYDAAEIDGANELMTLVRIVLPLSGPVVAVLALYYAVGHWNSYFSALLYISDANKHPLQLVIRDYLMNSKYLEAILTSGGAVSSAENAEIVDMMAKREVLKYSIIVVSALPMALIYPFIQRFFIQGLMVGSIKG